MNNDIKANACSADVPLFPPSVVLSSEEEEEGEDGGDGGNRTSHHSGRVEKSPLGNSDQIQVGDTPETAVLPESETLPEGRFDPSSFST